MAIGLVMPPLGLLIGAAGLIIENWEPIKEFFAGLWGAVTEGFTSAMNWILEKIEWVGSKIEEFKISIMSEEEFAAYEKQKAAEVEAAARGASNETYGGLFDDDLDRAASTTGRGGLGDNLGATGQNRIAQQALDQFADSVQKAANTGAYEAYGPDVGTASDIEARRLAAIEWDIDHPQGKAVPLPAANGRATKNELKVTFDPETGKIVKTQLKGDDNPDFVVRANAGGQ